MRILFASSNWRIANDLSVGYAGVQIAGIVTSFGQALSAVRESLATERVEVLVAEARLEASSDEVAGLSLPNFLDQLHKIDPNLRIVVVAHTLQALDEISQVGVELHVEHDKEHAAASLAQTLGLAPKSEVSAIIAVTGLQGGAGRTFVARKLAEVMADKFEHKRPEERGGVLLWEGDIKHPTLAFDAGFPTATLDNGRRTIAALLNSRTPRGERAMSEIASSIVGGEETKLGFDVLLAPHGIREVEALYRAYPDMDELRIRYESILEVLSRYYQAIVIDLGTDLLWDPMPRVALSRADAVALVASPCPSGLSSVMAFKEIVRDYKMQNRIRLILNTGIRHDPNYIGYLREHAEGTIELAVLLKTDPDANVWRELTLKLLTLGR
jgi:cellulose biosynthesis protein BcsQ